jgi:BirA family transcriptional regulator, biotin operon repressor / biotin---[acetyl-CoA-carboxylase] ligase
LPQPFQRSPFGPASNVIGLPFIELQSVDSTNNYARSLLHEGLAQHGTTIFTHEQLAGKGQRGKAWATEKDSNIILSIVVKPDPLQLVQQFELSACVAVAAHEFFMNYAGENTKIKWPNDLYWQDRKAAGILIENIIKSRESGVGSWKWAIVGIGININQTIFPSGLLNPVSLKQITGKNFDVIALAKEFCIIFNKYFQELITDGFNNIFSQYLHHLYKKNEIVKLKKGIRVFEAMIKTVSPAGKLIVHHSIEEEFDFGGVEWVI